ELLTYRLDNKLAYVPASQNYDEALAHASAAFPSLSTIPPARLSLNVPGRSALVRVAPAAWPAVLRDLAKYEIVVLEI
ncbi:hypothetical protein K488DRAFT_22058, partial [Vararia minispora EC-137]